MNGQKVICVPSEDAGKCTRPLLFCGDHLLLTSILGPGSALPPAVSLHRRHIFIRAAAPRPGKAQEEPAAPRAKLQPGAGASLSVHKRSHRCQTSRRCSRRPHSVLEIQVSCQEFRTSPGYQAPHLGICKQMGVFILHQTVVVLEPFLKLSLKVKVLVTRSCLTLCDPLDCSPPGSSVHGILQARILEWVAMLFSRGSS